MAAMWASGGGADSASSEPVDSPAGRVLLWPAMSFPLYMDAEIKPNRSLSQRGFVILICVITFANVASAVVFLKLHAHVIPVFLAIDVLAVIIATHVTHEGTSTWFEGIQLLAVYVVLGLTFFFAGT
jgi:uncharacterized membrane protein